MNQQSSRRMKYEFSVDMSQLRLPTWPVELSLTNLLSQPLRQYSYIAILNKNHITDVLKYIRWLADGEWKFPLAICNAVTSNSDRLIEIIEQYESCALRTDQTIIDFISVVHYSVRALTDKYKLLISRCIGISGNNDVAIHTKNSLPSLSDSFQTLLSPGDSDNSHDLNESHVTADSHASRISQNEK